MINYLIPFLPPPKKGGTIQMKNDLTSLLGHKNYNKIEFFIKSPCLHPVFEPPFTPPLSPV
jgi:hypothetical protein